MQVGPATDTVRETPPDEIPYIEVGGPGFVVEASAAVLRAGANGSKPNGRSRDGIRSGRPQSVAMPTGLSFEPAKPCSPLRPLGPELIAFHDPDHPLAELYVALWAKISSSMGATRPRVILFNGIGSVSWKTSVVLNLAGTCARQERTRVAVVEMPGGTSSLGRHLALPDGPGLAEVIRGEVPLESALRDAPLAHLRVLTSGNPRESHSCGSATQSVLKQLRAAFDWVLLDGPAQAGKPGDAELGRAADAVCTVVSRAELGGPDTDACLRSLTAQGCRLVGCVVTDP